MIKKEREAERESMRIGPRLQKRYSTTYHHQRIGVNNID